MLKILGVVIGSVGLLMLVYGVIGFGGVFYNDVILRHGGVNTGDDFVEVILFLIIGAFCTWVGLRWTKQPKDTP